MAQEFEFEENQNNYGVLDYKHAHTLKRYKELCDERCKVNVSKYDCFFAFSDRQFADGLKSIRPLQEGEKLVSIGAGGYGTKDGAKRLFAFYDSINDKIRSECNPQEVSRVLLGLGRGFERHTHYRHCLGRRCSPDYQAQERLLSD